MPPRFIFIHLQMIIFFPFPPTILPFARKVKILFYIVYSLRSVIQCVCGGWMTGSVRNGEDGGVVSTVSLYLLFVQIQIQYYNMPM